jgi:putative PIN family toxin of toxin-antitoxin system
MSTDATLARPSIVLDTNVVLDWLVFRDPTSVDLAAVITGGQFEWIVTPDMASELEHVLTYSKDLADLAPVGEVMAQWSHWARTVAPIPPGLAAVPRCSDPDDQMFIDLALQVGARALLTRDRALLKLARRAGPLGLRISTPRDWVPDA